MRKLILVAALALLAAVFVAGCDESATRKAEKETRDANYKSLQSRQPAEMMDYSPTREGINKWINTWEEPGKLSYVYLLAANGQKVGYYVFEGLPVSYCASLTPTDEIVDAYNLSVVVPAASMDGVYYSGSQCNQYFGFDATTGSYLEFSIGSGINFLVYEQPLQKQDAEPLGFTTIEEAKKAS